MRIKSDKQSDNRVDNEHFINHGLYDDKQHTKKYRDIAGRVAEVWIVSGTTYFEIWVVYLDIVVGKRETHYDFYMSD